MGNTRTIPHKCLRSKGILTFRNSSLAVAWTQVSGPAGVIFANPTSASTTASLPAQGTYVLQLAATDGQYTTPDQITIILKPALVNQAPVVGVAHPATIFFEDNLILNGDNEAALVSGLIPSWT